MSISFKVAADQARSIVLPGVKDGKPYLSVEEKKLDIYAKSSIRPKSWKPTREIPSFNNLRTAILDIETTGLDPQQDRILMLGFRVDGKDFIYQDKDEKILLNRFRQRLAAMKPYILAGHNIFKFDLPFLIERFNRHGLKHPFYTAEHPKKLNNATWNGQPFEFHQIFYRGQRDVNIVDTQILALLYDFSARELSGYGLKNITLELGLREERRLELTAEQIRECWESGDKQTVEKYLVYDLEDTERLLGKFLPSYYYQRLYLDWPLQKLYLTGNATKWNALLTNEYGGKEPESDPPYAYAGGITYGKAGLHLNVSKIDVSSMYPSIMIEEGICSHKDTNRRMLDILRYLRDERLRLKALAETGDKEADMMQKSLKIWINSGYGTLGTNKIGFNDFTAAALVTAYGRAMLRVMLDAIVKVGGEVVGYDTDGILFTSPQQDNDRIYQAVLNVMPKGIGLEHEWQAKALYIPKGAKKNQQEGLRKNYLIFHENGTVKRVGQFRSRDKSVFEKNFPVEFLQHFLISSDAADAYYEQTRTAIKNRQYPVENVLIKRTIGKNFVNLVQQGLGKVGDRITYFEGTEGPTKDVTKPYDTQHYVNKLDTMHKALCHSMDYIAPGEGRQLAILGLFQQHTGR